MLIPINNLEKFLELYEKSAECSFSTNFQDAPIPDDPKSSATDNPEPPTDNNPEPPIDDKKIREQTGAEPVQPTPVKQGGDSGVTANRPAPTVDQHELEFSWGWFFAMFGEEPICHGTNVYFTGAITKYSVNSLINLLEYKKEYFMSRYNKVNIYDISKMDIYLFINSPGGSIPAGFTLIDYIERYPLPITTIGTGEVASMAVPVLLAGKKRYLTPHTMVLLHQYSANISGRKQEIYDKLKCVEKWYNYLLDYISSKSKLSRNKLETIMRNDSWYTTQEALSAGLADGIWTEII